MLSVGRKWSGVINYLTSNMKNPGSKEYDRWYIKGGQVTLRIRSSFPQFCPLLDIQGSLPSWVSAPGPSPFLWGPTGRPIGKINACKLYNLKYIRPPISLILCRYHLYCKTCVTLVYLVKLLKIMWKPVFGSYIHFRPLRTRASIFQIS